MIMPLMLTEMSSECHMSIRHNSLFRLPYDGSDLVIVIQVVDSESGNHRCLIKLSSAQEHQILPD